MKLQATLCILVLNVAACGNHSASTSSPKNIFGDDDRVAVTSNDSPWSTVGYLNGCTATLIGKSLILTAAHCVFNADGSWRVDKFEYFPNMVNGNSRVSALTERVWYGTNHPYSDEADSRSSDWAIFLLDRDLGSTYGWMSVKNYKPEVDDYITLPGYSGDYNGGMTASVHQDCRVKEYQADGEFLHDCDMTRGASGAAIWAKFKGDDNYYVVGVQSGEYRKGGNDSLNVNHYDSEYANAAVPAATFFDKALELTKTYN